MQSLIEKTYLYPHITLTSVIPISHLIVILSAHKTA